MAWPPACGDALWAQEEEVSIGKDTLLGANLTTGFSLTTLARANGSELPRILLLVSER